MSTLEIVYGKTKTFRVTVEDPPGSGTLVDLTGKSVVFSAKHSYEDVDPPVIAGTFVNLTQSGTTLGQADLAFAPAATSTPVTIVPHRTTNLFWEAVLHQGADRLLVDRGLMRVLPAVDRP